MNSSAIISAEIDEPVIFNQAEAELVQPAGATEQVTWKMIITGEVDCAIEFKKKNLSTKEHEGSRRRLNDLILIVSGLSLCFFVWLCGEILFLKGYREVIMPTKLKIAASCVGLIGALLFAIFVWPTRYRYVSKWEMIKQVPQVYVNSDFGKKPDARRYFRTTETKMLRADFKIDRFSNETYRLKGGQWVLEGLGFQYPGLLKDELEFTFPEFEYSDDGVNWDKGETKQ